VYGYTENKVNESIYIWSGMCVYVYMGRDSSVGRASSYGLDVPGIESRRGRDFPHASEPVLRSTQPPVQRVPGLSRGVKRPGRGVDHPPQPSTEVKERVELYFSPFGYSWPVLGWTLPLTLLIYIYIYIYIYTFIYLAKFCRFLVPPDMPGLYLKRSHDRFLSYPFRLWFTDYTILQCG